MDQSFEKSKWNWRSPSVDRTSMTNFNKSQNAWSNGNMYRTSYNDMSKKKPVENKNYAIPKYSGFIPGMRGNSELGRVYTKITRRCYDKEDNFQKSHDRFQSVDFMVD
jgi:hypothetical protein